MQNYTHKHTHNMYRENNLELLKENLTQQDYLKQKQNLSYT